MRNWDVSIWARNWHLYFGKPFGKYKVFLHESWVGPVCVRVWANPKSANLKWFRVVSGG